MILNGGPVEKRKIISTLKNIFDIDGQYLHLDPDHALKNGEEILRIYPSIQHDKRHFDILKNRIINLLRFKNLSRRLFKERGLLKKNFKNFFRKSDDALKEIEERVLATNLKNKRPIFEKENLRDTHRPMKSERPLLQDRKNRPEPTKPTVNEKKYNVQKVDASQSKLKFDKKRSGEDIQTSQNFMDTNYNAFDSQPQKFSRSSTKVIDSALKLPIKKKGQPRDTSSLIRELEAINTVPDDIAPVDEPTYNDMPNDRLDFGNEPVNSFIPKTKTDEPRHNHIYRVFLIFNLSHISPYRFWKAP